MKNEKERIKLTPKEKVRIILFSILGGLAFVLVMVFGLLTTKTNNTYSSVYNKIIELASADVNFEETDIVNKLVSFQYHKETAKLDCGLLINENGFRLYTFDFSNLKKHPGTTKELFKTIKENDIENNQFNYSSSFSDYFVSDQEDEIDYFLVNKNKWNKKLYSSRSYYMSVYLTNDSGEITKRYFTGTFKDGNQTKTQTTYCSLALNEYIHDGAPSQYGNIIKRSEDSALYQFYQYIVTTNQK